MTDQPKSNFKHNRPPPQGWQGASADDESGSPQRELEAALQLLALLRNAVPNELNDQFASALRELLVALRALIDWYLERLDEPKPPQPMIVDIPIE